MMTDPDLDNAPAGSPSSRPLREAPKRGKARLAHKLAIIFGAILLVVSGGSLISIKMLTDHYEGMVVKEDILEGIPSAPQVEGESSPMNFLVLGSDSRAEDNATDLEGTGSRSDTIMIVHISKDRTSAFVFSIPRDSYINVPAGGTWRGGKNKINAAMSFGGAKLAAKTVYELTKIPLSGAIVVNFAGIQAMVGAVGGVRVCIPYTVKSSFSTKVWAKGCHELNPQEAEEFVRQRKGTPGGDLGRIKNQQHVIKGLIGKIKESGTLTNPGRMNDLITTAARSLTVDKSMNMMQLAMDLKDIDQENIKFATTPVVGTMNTDAGSSVELDMAAAEELFTAVRDDKALEWLAAHPQPEVASL